MDIERGNLEILFQWIPYEKVTLDELDIGKRHDCFYVNPKYYLEQCHHVFSSRSEDERNNCYAYLKESMQRRQCYPSSIFQLVLDVTNQILTYQSGAVLCRFEHLLRWREISLNLGQDFFICAYLADRDLQWREIRRDFSWLPIIMNDNRRILSIMQKGIAENHYHLKGSSRIFELNWICLMNHICGREREFRKIEKPLQRNGGEKIDFGHELYKKCQKAALYRLYLFYVLRKTTLLLEPLEDLLTDKQELDIYLSELQDAIDRAKITFGAGVASPIRTRDEDINSDNAGDVLDYAFRKELYDLNQNSYRILTGERSFIYDCFQACLTQKFSAEQQNIFYRYLKLYIAFRQELVQVKRQPGFQNFRNYEERKEWFIENRTPYMNEFLAMATRGQLEREYLKSLEVRITPKASSIELFKMLKKYNSVDMPHQWNVENKLRYVMHFPKSSDKRKDEFLSERNYENRQANKMRARALTKFMQSHSPLRLNVVGIDACANEIGCRPETFGQIFRYLHQINFCTENTLLSCRMTNTSQPKQFAMTYHVGEDFLDIVDGLRAIDEAILFCGLGRGCRIGHALALGIDPSNYYSGKVHQLLLPKQDLMDNIAWMLYMADVHGCVIDACLRVELLQEFQNLFRYVFTSYLNDSRNEGVKQSPNMSILDYYQSWKLRGDNPELYHLNWDEFCRRNSNKGVELEEWARVDFNVCSDIPEQLREIPMYYWLNRYYSFDVDVRKRGSEMVAFKVNHPYIALVRQLQDCMIQRLVKKGIAIETNPSSNYLIGTIHRYDQHPILRFNSRKLINTASNRSLSVSLNTDDQGVFDTLLENEYALMVLALEKATDEEGNKKYDIEDIYEWLNYVREMGVEQTFGQ